jgi:hypothetical protein
MKASHSVNDNQHQWENVELSKDSESNSTFLDKDGSQVTIYIQFITDWVDIENLRRCVRCGQESINFKEPKFTCDYKQIQDIMEE